MKNITWEFVKWIEKENLYALLKGIDYLGNEYESSGSYDPNNNEVTDLFETILK